MNKFSVDCKGNTITVIKNKINHLKRKSIGINKWATI